VQAAAHSVHEYGGHSVGELALLLPVGENNSAAAGNMQLDYTPGEQ